jgi:hypothetical protein
MKPYKIFFVIILTIPFFIQAQYVGGDGRGDVSTIITIVPLPVENPNIYPAEYVLRQNFPNPFNPKTVISYQLTVRSNVTLKVYDVLGNEIATLVNEEKPAGTYEVYFNSTDLPSGIYLYRLQANNNSLIKKMVLLK